MTECALCNVETDPTDGEFCFICDDLKSVCWGCMGQHLSESHTQAEYAKAEYELRPSEGIAI
jgi:hypothetical protein